jgi:hypothetical protein
VPIILRYRPQDDKADENQKLVEAVFAGLAEKDPGGIRCATFRLDDGTFVHFADIDGDNPLASLESFAALQDGIGDRCVEGETPNAQRAIQVGSYGFGEP